MAWQYCADRLQNYGTLIGSTVGGLVGYAGANIAQNLAEIPTTATTLWALTGAGLIGALISNYRNPVPPATIPGPAPAPGATPVAPVPNPAYTAANWRGKTANVVLGLGMLSGILYGSHKVNAATSSIGVGPVVSQTAPAAPTAPAVPAAPTVPPAPTELRLEDAIGGARPYDVSGASRVSPNGQAELDEPDFDGMRWQFTRPSLVLGEPDVIIADYHAENPTVARAVNSVLAERELRNGTPMSADQRMNLIHQLDDDRNGTIEALEILTPGGNTIDLNRVNLRSRDYNDLTRGRNRPSGNTWRARGVPRN